MGYAYSFADVTVGIAGPGGAFPITGSESGSADEGIRIAFEGDKSSLTVGADGSFMHNLHAANNGAIEISLLKNSPINQLLNALYDFQRTSGANFGQNTIVLTNTVSGDVYTNIGCGFKKFPDNSYGKDGPVLVWSFNVGRIDPKLGSGI